MFFMLVTVPESNRADFCKIVQKFDVSFCHMDTPAGGADSLRLKSTSAIALQHAVLNLVAHNIIDPIFNSCDSFEASCSVGIHFKDDLLESDVSKSGTQLLKLLRVASKYNVRINTSGSDMTLYAQDSEVLKTLLREMFEEDLAYDLTNSIQHF